MMIRQQKTTQEKKLLPDFLSSPDPSVYRKGSYLVVDVETTNLKKGDALEKDNRLVLVVWVKVDKDGKVTGKYSFKGETAQAALIEDIASVGFVVAQNAKFDLQWLARCGLDLRSVLVYDTQVAEYVLLGNRKKPLDLSSIATRYGIGAKDSLVSKLIKAGICPSTIPREWLLKYCQKDVSLTLQVFKHQLGLLDDSKLNVLYTRCLLTPCFASIEANGATLDKDRVDAAKREAEERLADIESELSELAGDINLNSPQQLARWLYGDLRFKELRKYGRVVRNKANKAFPDGQPLTDIDTILSLKATNKKQRRVQELLAEQSKVSSKLTKNLNFFKAVCDQQDGRFEYRFNQTVTVTHRTSSSGKKIEVMVGKKIKEMSAQGQNFPREMKPLFVASGDGRLIGENDGSQIEFRTAGHLGRDEAIRRDVINDEDIHQTTADKLTEAGEPTTRQEAKASTFRPLFAGRSGSPAVIEYCDFFREKYSGISSAQEAWAAQAVREGKVDTEWGMTFYFPGTRVRPDGSYTNFTNICNYPIQSFASAEFVLIALCHFWHLTRDLDIKIINTIHDSIISDLSEDVVEDYIHISTASMLVHTPEYLKKVYGVELFVPFGCGIKVGTHWNEPSPLPIVEQVCNLVPRYKDNNTEVQFDMHRTYNNNDDSRYSKR